MKNLFTNSILFSLICIIISAPSLIAQDDWRGQTIETKDNFPYLKDKYEMTLDQTFDTVWEAAKKSIEEINCSIITANTRQDDEGLYRGTIQSDFCIFAVGDTTLQNMRYYSVDLPFIRGGVWVNGRMQYKIIVRETPDDKVYVLLNGEISGMESHVTSKVHFWKSNGFKESMMMERIKMHLGLPYELKEQ
ncbi:MAG: hypothetical protein M9949_10580 [Candidatus Kapabacteria bacterium]|nr:hypothetical protein [Candidatus Kapabacteria bacterium]